MTRKSDKAKFVFLMLYFLILTIERIISLATVLTSDIAGYDLLDLYMSVLTAAAIIGAYTYMFLKVRFTAKPRSSDKPEQSVFGKLAIYFFWAEWCILMARYRRFSSPLME